MNFSKKSFMSAWPFSLAAAILGFAMMASIQVQAQDAAVEERARLRLYDGGVDEQPLQVQAELYNSKTDSEPISGEGEVSAPRASPQPSSVE